MPALQTTLKMKTVLNFATTLDSRFRGSDGALQENAE
jgi:hypothetical protein